MTVINKGSAQISAADLGLSELNDFSISVSNFYPFPNEEITAKIQGANFDFWRANIKWTLNGKTILQGKADDEIKFKVGGLGTSASLTAVIKTQNGESIRKSITLRPTDIDIIWQADTYTPYFYKGKSFISPLSNATVAAIPYFVFQGKKIAPENLLFKWYLNDDFQTKGWGKDSFAFNAGLFSGADREARVEISSQNETLIQQKTLRIPVRNPQINFYEYNSFEGVESAKTISGFKIASGEYSQFIAEPYFVPNDKTRELEFEWKINGQKIANTKPLNILNFSSEAGSAGSALIDLTVSYKDLLEKIKNSFRIEIQ